MRETVVNAKTAFIIHPLKAFQKILQMEKKTNKEKKTNAFLNI